MQRITRHTPPLTGLTAEEAQEGFILCVDKPLTWTSFNLVSKAKYPLLRRLRLRKLKVGHAGTLDPLATGVMLLSVGRATKLIEELQAGYKEYTATLRLGATTPSFDLEHEIDATFSIEHITREMIEATLPQFIGHIDQVPPTFSACKIQGKRAYDLARAGQEAILSPKTIHIEDIQLLDFTPPLLRLHVRCGKGTYIRSLARDLGQALHSGAHLTELRRTRVGDVHVDDCLTLDALQQWIDDTLPRTS